jgi:hypothetical protein
MMELGLGIFEAWAIIVESRVIIGPRAVIKDKDIEGIVDKN